MARIAAFLDPDRRPARRRLPGRCQALYALAAGGCSGSGSGQGRAKWGYLPERAHRLHLRDHRRGARPARRARGARAVRDARLRRAADRRAHRRPVRCGCVAAAVDGLARRPGRASTSATSCGLLPVTGAPAAADLLRRHVAGGHHVRVRACWPTRPGTSRRRPLRARRGQRGGRRRGPRERPRRRATDRRRARPVARGVERQVGADRPADRPCREAAAMSRRLRRRRRRRHRRAHRAGAGARRRAAPAAPGRA